MVGFSLLRAWDGAGYLDGYFAFKGADVSTAIHRQCSIVLGRLCIISMVVIVS